MGAFILLPWRSFLVLVLPISLFSENYRYDLLIIRLMIDIRRGLKVEMKFDLAQPFKPFEQLMGVLPSRSRKLLPEAYRV